MNVLVLSCNTGGGHNMCAYAIKEHFEEKRIFCEIIDALSFVSPRFSALMSNGHSFLYRYLPSLFRLGYSHYQDNPKSYSESSMLFRMLKRGAKRLEEYIEKRGFDTVVCTHVFAGMMLSEVSGTSFVSAFVATDYTCYAMSVKCKSDIYFIPDTSLSEAYTAYGIPQNKLVASGIPIRKSFYEKSSIERAKLELGMNSNDKHVLIMSGSIGCGPIKKITKQIASEFEKVRFTVICGRNAGMQKRMRKAFARYDNVNIVGFCDNISLYMDSADVYITKAGGISTTEAMIKQLPMIIVDAIGGCEEYNLRYFQNNGGALASKNAKDITEHCRKLIKSGLIRTAMSKRLEHLSKGDPAETIFLTMQNIKAARKDAVYI